MYRGMRLRIHAFGERHVHEVDLRARAWWTWLIFALTAMMTAYDRAASGCLNPEDVQWLDRVAQAAENGNTEYARIMEARQQQAAMAQQEPDVHVSPARPDEGVG